MRNQLALLESPFLNETIVDDPPDTGRQRESAWDISRHAEPQARDRDGWIPDDEAEEEAPCSPASHEQEEEALWMDTWVEEEAWSGSAEQVAFRDRVLAAHIARTRRRRGRPQRDLPRGERAPVAGTNIDMRSDAAAAAGALLAAASVDLATAKAAGDVDAIRTTRLTGSSGYRASDHQRRLWLEYFPKYYRRTRTAREQLDAGRHSDAAIEYMLRPRGNGGFGLGGRIAAPGYSNHQNGIAIDLQQFRTSGYEIPNDSGDAARSKWRASWFHAWLTANAGRFGFRPIATEEWHWEYRPTQSATNGRSTTTTSTSTSTSKSLGTPGGPTAFEGGKLWTFRARAVPTSVAVFCPPAALAQGEVDVLFFAHGMLGGCPRPPRVPEGFISDPPFRLGTIVAKSKRPVVLVVPFLDWNNPGTAAAFGSSAHRWHTVGKPVHLNAIVDEALTELGRLQGTPSPKVRRLIVAGHSRAHGVLEPLAHLHRDPEMRRGALSVLSEVWSLDATYAGRVSTWKKWLDANPSLTAHVLYRRHTKTGPIGDSFFEARGGRLQVTQVPEGHCEMIPKWVPRLLAGPSSAPSQETESSWSEEVDVADEGESAVDDFVTSDFEDLVEHHVAGEPESEDSSERQTAEDESEWGDSAPERASSAAEVWHEGTTAEDEAEEEDTLAFEFEDERYADDMFGELEEAEEEDEAESAPQKSVRRPSRRHVEPVPVPLGDPVPFAPSAPTGSYWPVRTSHRLGRLVSYLHASGIVGWQGRMFMAKRSGKVGGRTRARWHAGIDLFANSNDVVVACEAGTIVDFSFFYKAKSGQRTFKLLVEHEGSGIVVNYGEVRSDSLSRHGLRVGMRVKAGQPMAFVSDTQMLHVETYAMGTRSTHRWWKSDKSAPRALLNPTRYLLALAEAGLPARA